MSRKRHQKTTTFLGVPIQAQWHHGFRGPLRGHPISHSRCLGRKGRDAKRRLSHRHFWMTRGWAKNIDETGTRTRLNWMTSDFTCQKQQFFTWSNHKMLSRNMALKTTTSPAKPGILGCESPFSQFAPGAEVVSATNWCWFDEFWWSV